MATKPQEAEKAADKCSAFPPNKT